MVIIYVDYDDQAELSTNNILLLHHRPKTCCFEASNLSRPHYCLAPPSSRNRTEEQMPESSVLPKQESKDFPIPVDCWNV